MELSSCHPSAAHNFEVAFRSLKNLCTPGPEYKVNHLSMQLTNYPKMYIKPHKNLYLIVKIVLFNSV